jgi:hypothetical protein
MPFRSDFCLLQSLAEVARGGLWAAEPGFEFAKDGVEQVIRLQFLATTD